MNKRTFKKIGDLNEVALFPEESVPQEIVEVFPETADGIVCHEVWEWLGSKVEPTTGNFFTADKETSDVERPLEWHRGLSVAPQIFLDGKIFQFEGSEADLGTKQVIIFFQKPKVEALCKEWGVIKAVDRMPYEFYGQDWPVRELIRRSLAGSPVATELLDEETVSKGFFSWAMEWLSQPHREMIDLPHVFDFCSKFSDRTKGERQDWGILPLVTEQFKIVRGLVKGIYTPLGIIPLTSWNGCCYHAFSSEDTLDIVLLRQRSRKHSLRPQNGFLWLRYSQGKLTNAIDIFGNYYAIENYCTPIYDRIQKAIKTIPGAQEWFHRFRVEMDFDDEMIENIELMEMEPEDDK